MSSVLTCPVCKSSMREIDRSGVTIDVCTQCRGVWLDRGELEKLSGVLSAGAAAPSRGEPRGDMRGEEPRRWRDDDDDYDDDRKYAASRHGAHGQYKKKKGLSTFLDFFD